MTGLSPLASTSFDTTLAADLASYHLTPEQLRTLNEEVTADPDFRKPIARKIYEHGGSLAHARRAEFCGAWHLRRDALHHEEHEASSCMDPTCRYCQKILSHNTRRRWGAAMERTVQNNPTDRRISYLEISIPLERSKRLCERAIRIVARCVKTAGGRVHWENLIGFRKDRLIIRVLSLDDIMRIELPMGYTIEARKLGCLGSLRSFFNDLTEPEFIVDLDDRAEQSVILRGMRRLRAHGIKLPPKESDLFVKDNPITNNSTENLPDGGRKQGKPPRKCPQCGSEYIEVSQWFHADDPRPAEKDIHWRPISP